MKFARVLVALLGLWFVAASPYPLSPEVDCGAIGDGVADDYPALQACLNSGKVVRLTEGKAYRVVINWLTTPNLGLVIPAGGVLDTATNTEIRMEISGNAYGVRMQSNAHIIGYGRIGVSAVSHVDSIQSPIQAVIGLGAAYGEVTSPSNIGPFLNATGWSIENVTLWTAKPNGFGIAGIGGLSGTIRGVKFPDSANHVGVINFDWGTVGNGGATLAATRALWTAGAFYTVHPSHILVEDIDVGVMSNPAALPLRFSATDNITVRNWRIAGTVVGAVSFVGGDFGYEYAKDALTQRRAYLGNVIRSGSLKKANGGYAVSIDAFADNIARDTTYVPTLKPIYHSNIVVDDVAAEGNFSGAQDGVILTAINGASVRNIDMVGFNHGVAVKDSVSGSEIRNSRIYGNMGTGIHVCGSAAAVVPRDISIVDNQIWANGSSSANLGSTNSQIYIGNGARPFIKHNILGSAGEGGGYYGVFFEAGVTDGFIFSNYVAAVKAGGVGIAKGATAQIAWNFFDPSIPLSRQIN